MQSGDKHYDWAYQFIHDAIVGKEPFRKRLEALLKKLNEVENSGYDQCIDDYELPPNPDAVDLGRYNRKKRDHSD